MNFSTANIIGSLIFGSIGFVAFIFGKKTGQFKPMILGLALVAFPYMVPDGIALYGVGIALTVALYFFRD